MNNIVLSVIGWALCFLVGSLPFSFWVVKVFKGIDLRESGSGNVGATNVFRTQGKALGSLALALDAIKGVVAVTVIAPFFVSDFLSLFIYSLVAGLVAIAGHIWTPFLNWKGGKGMATSAGVFLGLLPLPFAIALAAFLITFYFSGIISLSSLVAAVIMPFAVFVTNAASDHKTVAIVLSLGLSLFIFYTHRANIGRLLRGEEKKIWNRK